MKKKSEFLISLLCVALSASVVNAHNIIYVSPTSDLRPDGSRAHPYSDINEAVSKAVTISSSDTVYVKLLPGTYYLDRTISITKNPLSPIVIQSDKNSKAIVSGAVPLKFTSHGDEWRAIIPEVKRYGMKMEQLYVNDNRAVRAKSPDKGYFYIEDSRETVHYRGNGRAPKYSTKCFKVNQDAANELKKVSYQDYDKIVIMFYHNWDNTRAPLTYLNVDSAFIFTAGDGLKPWNTICKGDRFVMENYKLALTKAGEWFCNENGELTYLPRTNESVSSSIAYVPVLSRLLEIKGTEQHPISNIVLRNISFQHSAYVMPKEGNKPFQAAANIDAAVQLDFAHDIVFENCEIKHTGNFGISFNRSCSDCRLYQSYLYDLGAGGVKVGEVNFPKKKYVTKRISVENNIIQKTGNILPCGVGIGIFHSSDNKVIHNEISNLLYSAISVGWIWGYNKSYAFNNEIAYNHIHHIGWGELSDMGAVYTLGKSPKTYIHHNVIHDVYSYDYGGWGLYTDEGSSDIVLENNLVYACKSGGFHQHYGKDNTIRNNIFAFGQFFQLQFTKVEKHHSFTFSNNIVLMDCGNMLEGPWSKANIDLHDNCFYSLKSNDKLKEHTNYKWAAEFTKHNVFVNPHFRDPYNGDFSFKSKKILKRIGFKPFDYSKVGVYGDKEWKNKALLPAEEIERFKTIILKSEKSVSGYYKNN